jgi:hypothetical protein
VPELGTLSLGRLQLRRPSAGRLGLMVVALGLGLLVAAIDSRPTWDDSGITAAMLILAAGTVSAIDGRRPSLWAALVGLPLPIIEVPATGSPAPVVALAFAAVGAVLGLVVHRAVRGPAID